MKVENYLYLEGVRKFPFSLQRFIVTGWNFFFSYPLLTCLSMIGIKLRIQSRCIVVGLFANNKKASWVLFSEKKFYMRRKFNKKTSKWNVLYFFFCNSENSLSHFSKLRRKNVKKKKLKSPREYKERVSPVIVINLLRLTCCTSYLVSCSCSPFVHTSAWLDWDGNLIDPGVQILIVI